MCFTNKQSQYLPWAKALGSATRYGWATDLPAERPVLDHSLKQMRRMQTSVKVQHIKTIW